MAILVLVGKLREVRHDVLAGLSRVRLVGDLLGVEDPVAGRSPGQVGLPESHRDTVI